MPARPNRSPLSILRRGGAVLRDEGPLGVLRRARVNVAAEDPDEQYRRWHERHAPRPAELAAMREAGRGFAYRPLVSVVVPTYNSRTDWLEEMVASVRAQTYEEWELCIADDASPESSVREVLERLCALDPERIHLRFRPENGGIAAASNSALELATGEFVALLDHDDLLEPHALHRVVERLQAVPDADVLYSDEDKLLLDGRRGLVAFKATWDPDLLLSTNYVCHLTVMRRRPVIEAGGFHEGFDGSQDHELLLRLTERTGRIEHIPDVLYVWRQVPGSAAIAVEEKPEAWHAGRRAVAAALERRGIDGMADLGPSPGLYDVRRRVPPASRVGIVLDCRHPGSLPDVIASLGRMPGMGNWTAIVVTPTPPAVGALDDDRVVLLPRPASPSRAAALTEAAARLDCDVLVFVGDSLVPRRQGWLRALVEQALRPEIACSGGRITDRRGRPRHEGYHVGGVEGAASVGEPVRGIRSVAAVSADCMAIRRALFEEAGGFDTDFQRSLFDVDLCLRLGERGLRTLYTPLAEMESIRGGAVPRPPAGDVALLRRRHPVLTDPFISPHLLSWNPYRIRMDGSTAGQPATPIA